MSSIVTIRRDVSVLLLVDIQPDFCPGGALAVDGGDEILEPVDHLLRRDMFDLCVATQDWHPAGHVSFASTHEGRAPMEVVDLHGYQQVLWPDHCVQGTPGAELHPELDWKPVSAIVRKGADPLVDSYSGFRNNWSPGGERPETGLAGYLRNRGVQDVYLCGLAGDVCVRWTAADATEAGFRTFFLWDLTRSIRPDDDEQLRRDLEARGVVVAESEGLRVG
jgi:nicotinamidase/pyrazinamidase